MIRADPAQPMKMAGPNSYLRREGAGIRKPAFPDRGAQAWRPLRRQGSHTYLRFMGTSGL